MRREENRGGVRGSGESDTRETPESSGLKRRQRGSGEMERVRVQYRRFGGARAVRRQAERGERGRRSGIEFGEKRSTKEEVGLSKTNELKRRKRRRG
jgi:hypothetical protein